ncbi:hypothetical protein P691DRAFT_811547 [Macrolepiota fuliginosa MF-IS2]|uniref:Uncharacterized protein n=1 Tax=Macrolepiota fuliginosa MF-IS2 TaxID=1400762 RepID=A0A9P6C5Z7_9AGAR|nr:hypothetical protein P691DRAFT_811547 [Macrolepiota fuliginosa MF-IS2]
MSTGILNPDNYLSYLSPADAFQFEVARNLYLAVLGATIWDILIYIPDDLKILRMQRGIRVVNVCFVTSRLFALCYVLLSALGKTIPVDNCNSIFIGVGCCCVVSVFSSSFLFLRRVQAVYANNCWVRRFFFVLWLIEGGLVTTVPIGVRAAHIPGTKYCIDSQPGHYVIAGGILPLVFDTFVFLAISLKVGRSHSIQDARVSWNTLVSGRALPRLSRAILQGGQQYYLITSGVYLILVILLGLPSIPPIYRNMLAFPSVSLSASMACRVYRNIKLLDISEEMSPLPVSDLNFARGNHTHKDGPDRTPFSLASSESMELRGRLGGTVSSGTLGVDTTTKSQGAWSEQPTEIRKPEQSLACETRPHAT